MVDMFTLVVSLGMLAMVVFFALRFDRSLPWFERPQPPGKAPAVRQAHAATAPGPAAASARRPSRLPVR